MKINGGEPRIEVTFLLSKAEYSSKRFINDNSRDQWRLSQLLLCIHHLFDLGPRFEPATLYNRKTITLPKGMKSPNGNKGNIIN